MSRPTKKKQFYAFPIDVVKRINERNGHLQGLDEMLRDAMEYCLHAVYQNQLKAPRNKTRSDAFIASADSLGIDPIDISDLFERSSRTYARYGGAKVFTAIGKKAFWNAYSASKNETCTDFFVMQIVCLLAIKSILGVLELPKSITWDFVLSRMDGSVKKKGKHLKHVQPYATRKMRKKMIDALCKYWGLSYYAPHGVRVPWFSFAMTPDELAEYIAGRKAKHRRDISTSI